MLKIQVGRSFRTQAATKNTVGNSLQLHESVALQAGALTLTEVVSPSHCLPSDVSLLTSMPGQCYSKNERRGWPDRTSHGLVIMTYTAIYNLPKLAT